MPIIGRGSQPQIQQPEVQRDQTFKPKKNWWQSALDVLTTGEQFFAGTSLRKPDEGFIEAGVRGVKEDLTGVDVTKNLGRLTRGREAQGFKEKAAETVGGVLLGGVIDPLTYTGLGPIAKTLGFTSKFALKAVGAGKAAKSFVNTKAGYNIMRKFNQGYDINPATRKQLFRSGVQEELSKQYARNLGGKLKDITTKLSPADNRAITSFMTGQIDDLPDHLQKMKPLWQKVRKNVDDVGALAVKTGALSPDIYRKGQGSWLPRLYTAFSPQNRTNMLKSFFSKNSDERSLREIGILRTLDRGVLNEFRDNVNSQIAQGTGKGGDILGNESLLDELNMYAAGSWDELKSMLSKSDNVFVTKWYRSNQKIVDEAIDAYKDIEKQTGLGMFEYRNIAKSGQEVSTLGRGARSLRGPSDIARKDISEDFQKAMGIIEDPANLVETAIERVALKIPTAQLFKTIAKNEQVLTKSQLDDLAIKKQINPSNFVELGKDKKKFGELAGKWVNKSVHENVMGARSLAGAIESKGVGQYMKSMLQLWKAGKTVFNSASQARQFMSNVIMLDMKIGGKTTPGAIAVPLTKAGTQMTKMIKGKADKTVKEAEKAGLFVGTFFKSDFGAVNKSLQAGQGSLAKGAQKALQVPGQLWEHTDNLFRLAAYNHFRGKGMKPEEAVAEAHKAFFNYSDIPQVVARGRDYIPFLTFGYKSAGFFAETMYRNPNKVLQWYRLENAVSKLDPKNAEVDPENLRDFLQDQVPLYVDENGRQKRLSMEYIYPWGSFTQSNPLGMIGGGQGLLPFGQGLNPLISEPIQQIFNKDLFFDQPIASAPTAGGRAKQRAQHAAKAFVPGVAAPFLPGTTQAPGGKILEAIQGRPDVAGREFTTAEAVLSDIFGVKTSTVDLAREKSITGAKKKAAVSKIQKGIKQIRKSKRLTPEEKTREVNKLRSELRKLRDQR